MNSAIEQVKRSKARYCRYLDTRQWQAFASLFVPDATARVIDPDGALIAEFNSASAFVDAAQKFLEGARSIHQVHNDELEMVSDREISATWSMEDYIVFPVEPLGEATSVHGYGHYHESWILSEGEWRIARLELRRTILEVPPNLITKQQP